MEYEDVTKIRRNNCNLEEIDCKTFACPSLNLIDEKGKELRLKDVTIKKAKDMAIEYLKKTYHVPVIRLSHICYHLCILRQYLMVI
ncbi:MAG: hypothetical protein LAN71_17045 [Acidobacteriia bacterium]|nr:hypothetical protein [Terriglobia bacterium]